MEYNEFAEKHQEEAKQLLKNASYPQICSTVLCCRIDPDRCKNVPSVR